MNPTLAALKQQFQAGTLSKPDFIRTALQTHKTLFEYVGITRSTDVKEILINTDGVSFVLAFRWSQREGRWVLDVADADAERAEELDPNSPAEIGRALRIEPLSLELAVDQGLLIGVEAYRGQRAPRLTHERPH